MQDWPMGLGRFILDETDSTNEEALRLVGRGASAPFWVLAHRQTAGRGRRGRAWVGQAGNFFATLTLRPSGSPADWAMRSFVMAVALREALVAATGQTARFALKWPNDVLLDGGKLLGILLESDGKALRIGVGINLATAPAREEVEARAFVPVSLKGQLGLTVTPEDMLTHLAIAYDRWEHIFQRDGFEPVRAEWLSYAAMRGQTITARLADRELTGIFDGLDETGALILRVGATTHHLPAGEVFFETGGGA